MSNFNPTIAALAVNPLTTLVSIFIGIIGVVASFIFYFKGKQIKKLKIELKSINLLKNSIENIKGLNIEFLGNSIPNLTVTKLALWSDGNHSIYKQDLAFADPLSINALNNTSFLEVKIIYSKNKCNLITTTLFENNKQIIIDFDFLNYEDGAVIQILHTGSSSNDIEVSGTIIGGKLIKKSPNKKKFSSKFFLRFSNKKPNPRFLGYATMLIGFFTLLSGIFFYYEKTAISLVSPSEPIILLFTGLTYSISGYYLSRKRTPKGFESFEEGI